MKAKKGLLPIIAGLLLIAAALAITVFNLYENRQAERQRVSVMEQLLEQMPKSTEPDGETDGTSDNTESVNQVERTDNTKPIEIIYPDYVLNPGMEMPVKNIDGYDYIGILTLPSLELELPVMSEWDYTRLRINPCRYSGSVYLRNMVICAHNYNSHFGRLPDLSIGDELALTDMDGNVFRYRVAEMTTLQPMAVTEMTDSGWDLTLFTCTVGGRTRVTVRCEQIGD